MFLDFWPEENRKTDRKVLRYIYFFSFGRVRFPFQIFRFLWRVVLASPLYLHSTDTTETLRSIFSLFNIFLLSFQTSWCLSGFCPHLGRKISGSFVETALHVSRGSCLCGNYSFWRKIRNFIKVLGSSVFKYRSNGPKKVFFNKLSKRHSDCPEQNFDVSFSDLKHFHEYISGLGFILPHHVQHFSGRVAKTAFYVPRGIF